MGPDGIGATRAGILVDGATGIDGAIDTGGVTDPGCGAGIGVGCGAGTTTVPAGAEFRLRVRALPGVGAGVAWGTGAGTVRAWPDPANSRARTRLCIMVSTIAPQPMNGKLRNT